MAQTETNSFIVYIFGILGIAWSLIVGLLSYIWHSRSKATDDKTGELKRDHDNLVLKQGSDVSELHKRIDENFSRIAVIKSDISTLNEKIKGQKELLDYKINGK